MLAVEKVVGRKAWRWGSSRAYAVPAEGWNGVRTDVEGRYSGRRTDFCVGGKQDTSYSSSVFLNSLPFFDVKADAAPLEMGHDIAGQLKGGTAPAFLPGLVQGQQRG